MPRHQLNVGLIRHLNYFSGPNRQIIKLTERRDKICPGYSIITCSFLIKQERGLNLITNKLRKSNLRALICFCGDRVARAALCLETALDCLSIICVNAWNLPLGQTWINYWRSILRLLTTAIRYGLMLLGLFAQEHVLMRVDSVKQKFEFD